MSDNLKFRRWIDRKLTANIWTQLGLFVAIFIISWACLLLLYNLAFQNVGANISFVTRLKMTIADIFSSDRFASCAYGENDLEFNSVGIRMVMGVSCLVGAVIFQGLLIATITNIIQTRADKVREGDVHYKFINHYLIFGYDDNVPSMVNGIMERDENAEVVVVVEKNVVDCRESIVVGQEKHKVKRLTVLHGSRTDENDIKKCCVLDANRVYVVGENNEANRDIRNMECYNLIHNELKAEVHCWVYAEEQAFFNLQIQHGPNDPYFHPFNYYELWSRTVMVDNTNQYLPLDYRSSEDNIYVRPEKYVHMVVMGLTKMGEAMARETAFLAHYPNFIGHKKRTRITFVDTNMQSLMSDFVGRNQTFFQHCNYSYRSFDILGNSIVQNFVVEPENDFLDLEFEFVDTQCMGSESKRMLIEWAKDDEQFLTVAFCSNEEKENYLYGYSIPEQLSKVPVWVYMRHPAQELFKSEVFASRFSNVRFFGSSDIDVTEEPKELQWAKWVDHIYSTFYNDLHEWDSLSINKRWSNIYNACSLTYKLRSVGASYENGRIRNAENVEKAIELLGEAEHNRWDAEQLLLGFRSTDANEHERWKDGNEKKRMKLSLIHDNIRPYSELDEDAKSKDKELLLNLIKVINQEMKI